MTITKTDERLIVDIPAVGYAKTDVKVKVKTLDDKAKVFVVDVKKATTDEKFGVYKNLDGFREEFPVNDEVFDIAATAVDVKDGNIRISVPKKDDYKTKTLVDFSPAEPGDAVPVEE